jgi:hypothetical protein
MKFCRSKSCGDRFYLLPKWLNCITWTPGDVKIYRWGKWHFSFKTKAKDEHKQGERNGRKTIMV